MTAGWVLAHQGGWDEALFSATPVVIFVVLFRVAAARAARAEARSHESVDREATGPGRDG